MTSIFFTILKHECCLTASDFFICKQETEQEKENQEIREQLRDNCQERRILEVANFVPLCNSTLCACVSSELAIRN